MKGWIFLHRQIQDCWIWQTKPFSEGQAWIDLLLRANHKDTKIFFNGSLMEVQTGTFICSISRLSECWGWDRKRTSKFLNVLESDNMIEQKRDNHCTAITIVKYKDYQTFSNESGTTEGQGKDNGSTTPTPPPTPTVGQQLPTNNNDNNENNDNKNKYMCAFEDFWKVYPRKKEKGKAYKCYQARLKDGWSPEELLEAATNYAEECKRDKTEEKYTKLGATFLSSTTPFADHLNKEKEIEHDYTNDSPELTAEELEELKTLKLGEW